MRALLALLLALLVVPASVPHAAATTAGPVTHDATSPTEAPLAQNTTTSENDTDEPRLRGVAFFTTYSRDSAPPVRIGFGAEAGADGFFVLTNTTGAVVGQTEYEHYDSMIHADGLPIPFTKPVTGIETLTVTAYDDTNGNQEFDPEVDEPYRDEDGATESSTMTYLFPNESETLQTKTVEPIPGKPGAEALHHFRLEPTRDIEVHAVALNYRYSGIAVDSLTNDSAGAGLVYPELSNRRTDAKRVDRPLSNVLVIEPDNSFTARAGDPFVINVDGLRNPPEPRNVTVIVNPYGEAYATTATIEPSGTVPSIDLVQVSPEKRDAVRVNLHFPSGRKGVLEVRQDGEVIGRSQPVGGQPDMHVDFLDVRVDRDLEANEEVTVTLLGDPDGDGTYEDPYTMDGEPVSRTVQVLKGLETGDTTTTSTSTTLADDPTTDTTTTTVPGFGILAVLVALGLLAVRRW